MIVSSQIHSSYEVRMVKMGVGCIAVIGNDPLQFKSGGLEQPLKVNVHSSPRSCTQYKAVLLSYCILRKAISGDSFLCFPIVLWCCNGHKGCVLKLWLLQKAYFLSFVGTTVYS